MSPSSVCCPGCLPSLLILLTSDLLLGNRLWFVLRPAEAGQPDKSGVPAEILLSFTYILSKNTHFGDQSIFQLLLLIVLKAS